MFLNKTLIICMLRPPFPLGKGDRGLGAFQGRRFLSSCH